MSEVIGSLLLVGLTTALAAGLSISVLQAFSGPGGPPVAELEAELLPVDCTASEDARLVLHHVGGEALPATKLVLHVTAGDEVLGPFPGSEADFATDADGHLGIGERWTIAPLTLDVGEPVLFELAQTGAGAGVVWSGGLSAPEVCPS